MGSPSVATRWLATAALAAACGAGAWLSGCSASPQAAPADCGCALADGDTSVVPSVDTSASSPEDVAVAAPRTPTPVCADLWVELQADHTGLVAPPLDVTLTAHSGGVDLTGACDWQVGPSEVCAPGPLPASVRRVGDGLCTAVCRVNGWCGALQLPSKTQTYLYVVGGEVTAFPPPPTGAVDAARIQRLRTADMQWDQTVAFLPEYRIQPAVAIWDGSLWVIGGETGGSYQAVEYWDVFFPTCSEAIITPTQLKAEVGCRAVRRLNLLTGAWDSPAQWLHPRVNPGWRQIGSRVYLLGGVRAKTVTEPKEPELLALADLSKAEVGSFEADTPGEFLSAFDPLPWPPLQAGELGGVPLLLAGGKTWLVAKDAKYLGEKDIGWPCPEDSPRAVVVRRRPTGDETLVVASKVGSAKAGCPVCPTNLPGLDGQPQPWCETQRWAGKVWSKGPLTPWATIVEAPDGLYALAADATWRLEPGAEQWQPVAPPLPYGRFGFAAVAVTQ